jgi:hypothetical protein
VRSVHIPPNLAAYLRSADYLDEDLKEAIAKPLAEAGTKVAVMSLDDATAERFRDLFTERLAKAGFRTDYALSSEGADLEDLIDRFAG